jgi:hypothetical protein
MRGVSQIYKPKGGLRNEEAVSVVGGGHADCWLHFGILQTRPGVRDERSRWLQLVGPQQHHG